MNAPNAVTLVRIALVPAMLAVLLEADGGSLLAAGVFAIAASTDGIDGYLARSRREVTRFGKVMDPIADKLLIVTALVALVALDRLAAWVAIVIVARELAVSGLRLAAGRRGIVIAASPVGRLKTGSQVAAVLVLIAADDPEAVWVMALVYTAVIVTVVSGIDYFRRYRGEVAA
jgi:CDP-diacylglycerol--glycerol-3-phosphate 3-phosphatidyltransferase